MNAPEEEESDDRYSTYRYGRGPFVDDSSQYDDMY
jgi:hypothetical protein